MTVKVVCYHGSPGVPQEFDELSRRIAAYPVEAVVRDGYPGMAGYRAEGAIREPAVLIGYSWGCVAALRAAVRDRAQVRALGFVAPYLIPQGALAASAKVLLTIPLVGGAVLRASGPRRIAELLVKSCAPAAIPEAYRSIAPLLARPASLRAAVFEKEAPELDVAGAVAELAAAGVSFGVLWGTGDQTSSEDVQVAPLRTWLKLAVDQRLEGAGHAIPWTHPAELARFVEDLIRTSVKDSER